MKLYPSTKFANRCDKSVQDYGFFSSNLKIWLENGVGPFFHAYLKSRSLSISNVKIITNVKKHTHSPTHTKKKKPTY